MTAPKIDSAPPAYNSDVFNQSERGDSSPAISRGRWYNFLSLEGLDGPQQKTARVCISVALGVIAAVAAGLMLTYGFNRLDFAVSSLDSFVGGFLAYMGAVYGIVAIANGCIACSQLCKGDQDQEDQKDILKMQVGCSLFAPVVALPYACKFALEVGCLHALLDNGGRHR